MKGSKLTAVAAGAAAIGTLGAYAAMMLRPGARATHADPNAANGENQTSEAAPVAAAQQDTFDYGAYKNEIVAKLVISADKSLSSLDDASTAFASLHLQAESLRAGVLAEWLKARSSNEGEVARRHARRYQVLCAAVENAFDSIATAIPEAERRAGVLRTVAKAAREDAAALDKLNGALLHAVGKAFQDESTDVSDAVLAEAKRDEALPLTVRRLLTAAAQAIPILQESSTEAFKGIDLVAARGIAACNVAPAPLPPFAGSVWFTLASWLMENEGKLPASSANLPLVVRQGKATDKAPTAVDCFFTAVTVNNGNHSEAWRGLCEVAEETGSIKILGKTLTELQCLSEHIRCTGGVEDCPEAAAWHNLAVTLKFDPENESGIETISIPAGSDFSPVLHDEKPTLALPVDRKLALVRCLTVDGSSIPSAWLELSQCLPIGFADVDDVEAARYEEMNAAKAAQDAPKGGNTKTKRATNKTLAAADAAASEAKERTLRVIEGERVSVGGLSVGRVDCICLALSLVKGSAEGWFRLAMALSDHEVCRRAMIDSDGKLRIHANVYERIVLDDSSPVNRVDALVHAVSLGKKNPKYWFALGTTLLERPAAADGSPASVAMPTELVADTSSGTAVANEDSDTTPFHLLSGDDCLAQAIAVKPQYATVVEQWRAKKKQ